MLNVLLVDDNPDILSLNKHLLMHLGCSVTTRNDPCNALQLIEESNPFDVIITDVKMPKMNGIEFLKAVRARYPFAPIIFTSASSHAEMKLLVPPEEAKHSLFGGCFSLSRFKAALEGVKQRA
jgi:CheY-like chemotaxis protein